MVMTDVLPFEQYLAIIDRAAAALALRAARAGLEAPVPTCPRWRVADLVAHQGMVHRWAASNLRLDGARVPNKTEVLRDVPAEELIDWLTVGAHQLLTILRAVDRDVAAMVFLNDPPSPLEFWARRQAHETTVHSVDALAAALGRLPTAEEAAVAEDVARDGLDELLTGFFTRGRSRLADGQAFTVAVTPHDSDTGWTLHFRDGRMTVQRLRSTTTDTGATFTGSTAQLYLGMWNRGSEIRASGTPGVLDRWQSLQKIRWS